MASHGFLQTTFPVLTPEMKELHMSKEDFAAFVATLSEPKTAVENIEKVEVDDVSIKDTVDEKFGEAIKDQKSAFMDGLLADKVAMPSFDYRDGKTLTTNGDVTYNTSFDALVDLFYALGGTCHGSELQEKLEKAWAANSDTTLKIIWNARSIHLGKGDRNAFYRAMGWLYNEHPATLMTNLFWLVRPLIQKKAQNKDTNKGEEVKKDVEMTDMKDEEDFEMIDDEVEELEGQSPAKKQKVEEHVEDFEFDVKYGVAHGYWKDLLNILVLAANDELSVDGDPKKVFNVQPIAKQWNRDWTEGRKKKIRQEHHERVVQKLNEDSRYRALHLCVARLFAEQLKIDMARLQSGSKADLKSINLAGKWAPTHKEMHDRQTFIVSTIAEVLHPFDTVCPSGTDPADRETYLKYARMEYHLRSIPPLRKHLDIVERHITANKFEDINYGRIPSLAMKQYTELFAKKDFDRFDKYLDKVAQGQAQFSGATLLPSVLVSQCDGYIGGRRGKVNALVDQKLQDIKMKSLGGQWDTLVKRIKDSGTLESSIAVCDVSGSMSSPRFSDSTCPMDAAIGLSLLIAEVTEKPFGGAIITFSSVPEVVRVGGADDKKTFKEKVNFIKHVNWGGSTNFVAVFEDLILPMAVEHKLKPEDMVKKLFVFSDMQFNSANGYGDRWSTSYERIQKKYKEAGYEMPELVFWDLAGGQNDNSLHYYHRNEEGSTMPVTAEQEGTTLVSGYSQGQLKMFLDGAGFEEPEKEETVEVKEDEEEVVVEKRIKKDTPVDMVKKAISHEAYRMLKVMD